MPARAGIFSWHAEKAASRRSRRCYATLPIVLLPVLLLGTFLSGKVWAAGEAGNGIVPERQVRIEGSMPLWKENWDKARQLVRQRDYKQAIGKYGQVLVEKPDLEEARWELARIYLLTGDRKQAAALLEALHEKNAVNLEYTAALGELLVGEKKYGRAKLLLEEVLNRQGDSVGVLRNMIAVQQQIGDKKELLDLLRRYLRLVPGDDAMRLLTAQTAFDLGEFQQAGAFLQPLVEKEPGNVAALRVDARVHERLGLHNQARKFWQQLLDRQPADVEANLAMAAYLEGQPGSERQALDRLLAVQGQKDLPDDYDYQVGSLYAQLLQFDRALPFLEKFHRKNPDDKSVLRLMVKTYAALGDRQKTLALLEKYFVLEQKPAPQELRQAAELYDAAGRYREAIPFYRALLDQAPDDPELLEVLAKDLLAIGEEEGALGMWKLLLEKTPQRLDVQRSMADLLEKLGRDKELVDVLAVLVRLQPNDTELQIRLAEAYRRLDDRSKCAGVVGHLYGAELKAPAFLGRRGALAEYLGWCGHALDDYLVLLSAPARPGIDRASLRLAALRCAGKTGRVKIVARLAEEMQKNGQEDAFVLAAAYRDAGDLCRAESLYRRLLASQPPNGEQKIEVLTDLADIYRQQGLVWEERQMQLQALLAGEKPRTLAALALTAARDDRPEEARGWLERLEPAWSQDDAPTAGAEDEKVFRRFHLARILLLLDKGREGAAGEMAADFVERCNKRLPALKQGERQRMFGSLLELAGSLQGAGRKDEVSKVLSCAASLADLPGEKVDLLLARAVAARQAGDRQGAKDDFDGALHLAQDDPTLQLTFVKQAQRLGLAAEAADPASTLADACPGSLAARELFIDNLEQQKKQAAALEASRRAMEDFPDSLQPRIAAMRLAYRLGKFAESYDLFEGGGAQAAARPDLALLAARSLWSAGRHEEAVAFYKKLLVPNAATQFSSDEKSAGVLPAESFWPEWLDWLRREKKEPLAEKLSPRNFDRSAAPSELDTKAAGLSALFAWQNRIARELAAREAVQRFEYYRAGRLYKALLQEEKEPDLPMLFDLAGIYSRQDRPGEEAAIYEMLQQANADFPGLKQAMEQNSLKRRPQTGAFYAFKKEEGRQDKKAISRQSGGVTSWLALAGRQELSLQLERILYQSTLDDSSEWSSRAEFEYSTAFWQGLNISLGAGVEKPGNDSNSQLLLKGRLDGEVGDSLSWHISYLRDRTDDTIQSLMQNICQESLNLGSALDVLPRLQLGVDYEADFYNDGNLTEGYDFWTSYLLLTEPTELSINYSYEFKDSKDTSYPHFIFLNSTGNSTDHPYYVPHNYWLNKFGVYFKHSLSAEKFGRGIPRYYEIALSIGHDMDGYAVQTSHAAFFAQLARQLLIEASANITTSEPYRSKDISLSINYRW